MSWVLQCCSSLLDTVLNKKGGRQLVPPQLSLLPLAFEATLQLMLGQPQKEKNSQLTSLITQTRANHLETPMGTWQKPGGSGSVSQPYNKPQRSALKFEGEKLKVRW